MELVEKFVDLSIRKGSTLTSLSKEPENLKCVLWTFLATVSNAAAPGLNEAREFLDTAGSWLAVSPEELAKAAKELKEGVAVKINLKNLTNRVNEKVAQVREDKRQWALNRQLEIANQRIDTSKDEKFMNEALIQAQIASDEGEVPIGAIVVDEKGEIIGHGYNQVIGTNDPTAHAEIVAIRMAAKRKGNYRLEGCSIYVTMEPCPMCSGAIINSRFSRLIYGVQDQKGGAVDSVLKIFNEKQLNHHTVVRSSVKSEECLNKLREFFVSKRRNKEGGDV